MIETFQMNAELSTKEISIQKSEARIQSNPRILQYLWHDLPKYSGRNMMETIYSPSVSTSLAIISVCQVWTSTATIINSFRTKAVNEMETILMNSDSNRTSEHIMMAPPIK